MEDLKQYIRSVPDFPKPGINFYDITTLIESGTGFNKAVTAMEAYVRSRGCEKIVAVEARGLIFGGALATRLGIGLAPARKPGKLPYKTIHEVYALEYGTDKLYMHEDAIKKGEKVVIVDDLLATGGTVDAVGRLVERLGGVVAGVSAVISLSFLPWPEKLMRYDVNYLVSYDSE